MLKAMQPADIHLNFKEAFKEKNLDKMAAAYSTDIVYYKSPDEYVIGFEAAKEALKELLQLDPKFDLTVEKVIENDKVALLYSSWTMVLLINNQEVTLTGLTTDVAMKQTDGSWLCVIDNPFGIEVSKN